jgi:hypothetical protein
MAYGDVDYNSYADVIWRSHGPVSLGFSSRKALCANAAMELHDNR